MPALRDTDQLLWPAVAETIAALSLDSKDAATVKLARQYARTIDQTPDGKAYASAMRWIGPLLLDALEQLGATPAARARLAKGDKPPDARESQLTRLRKTQTRGA